MTLSRWTFAGIAVAVLLVGYAFGRFATPSKLIERDRIVEISRDTELTWHAYVGHTEIKSETKVAWKTETKWLPGGVVVQTVVANSERTETSSTDVTTNDGKLKERTVEKIVDRERIVEAAKPAWLVGAKVGLRLDDGQPIYGGEVARRIIGPVFVGAWAQAGGMTTVGAAAGLGVTLLF
jgi:acetyl-CoA carboxylase carboxyltransferase component